MIQFAQPRTIEQEIEFALRIAKTAIEEYKSKAPEVLTERKTVSKRWIKENYNISYKTIDARMKDGSLKYRRLGKRIFFYTDELEQAIAVKPIKRQTLKITK